MEIIKNFHAIEYLNEKLCGHILQRCVRKCEDWIKEIEIIVSELESQSRANVNPQTFPLHTDTKVNCCSQNQIVHTYKCSNHIVAFLLKLDIFWLFRIVYIIQYLEKIKMQLYIHKVVLRQILFYNLNGYRRYILY